MFNALHEIEHRKQVFDALDVLIKEKFIITPNTPSNRIRRNTVHETLMHVAPQNGGGIHWYIKKLIGEKLESMGVRKVLSTGRRWFTNIQFKQL